FFLFTTPLLAIPSPDLVVNFVASAAQVLGVLTLFLGGFAVSARKGTRSSGPSAKGLRWSFRIAVTLLLVSLGANVFQYFARIDERNQRLQTNLWRSSQEAGKKVGDVNLKTLSYSDQLKHPQAFNTEDLVRWIAEGRPMNLIDVREPEEVEMGYIQGA